MASVICRITLINPGVLGVAGVCVLVSALAAGVTTLAYARSTDLSALHNWPLTGLSRRSRLQGILLALQGALSIVLLVGAGLFLRSLHTLETLDVGLDRDQSLILEVDFTGAGREEREVAAFFNRALERVSAVPGVAAAGLGSSFPLRGVTAAGFLRLPGRDGVLSAPPYGLTWASYVTPGFFQATGMRIVEGRTLRETDRDSGRAIVVNESLARLGWGTSAAAVGECVLLGRQQPCTTVVGVVADARSFSVLEEDAHPSYYIPLAPDGSRVRALFIRMTPGVARIDNTLRQALHEIDASLPYIRIETLGEALDPQIRPWRLGASMFTAFGLLAGALAMIGLWSSVSYAANQRRHEFAVRQALGASRRVLVSLVLGDGIRTALVAVGAGLVIAGAASPFIADLLFEVSPRDPFIFGSIAAGVLVVATGATIIPAWRASRIHPSEALRAE